MPWNDFHMRLLTTTLLAGVFWAHQGAYAQTASTRTSGYDTNTRSVSQSRSTASSTTSQSAFQSLPRDRRLPSEAGEASRPDAEASLFSANRLPSLRGSRDAANRVNSRSIGPVEPSSSRINNFSQSPVQPALPQQGPGRVDTADEDLFAADGFRIGTLHLYPSVSVFAGASDNLDVGPKGEAGQTGTIEGALKIQSDWDRHQMEIDAKTGLTGYNDADRTPDHDVDVNGKVRLDLFSATTVSVTGSFQQQREDAGNAELLASGGEANVQRKLTSGITLDHKLSRLQLQLRGSLGNEHYDDDSTRDYTRYVAGGRIGYEVTDQLVPFVDLELERKSYEEGPNQQDGKSLRGSIGLSVQDRLTLSGEASVGFQTWRPDTGGQKEDTILYADTSVTWSPHALWTFNTGVSTSLSSTTAAAHTVSTRAVRLSATYLPRKDVKLAANGVVTFEDYRGSTREDLLFDASLSAEYALNRYTQFIMRAKHQMRDSNAAGNDFRANTFELGLKFQK